ncbi:DEAD/DEAH box helicase [Microbulbifer sp. MCCC 1A16149]|uniref:DEAD/DEAH box helicase n=1 Tax=Microbulbifer sp. MCCC 1A16149 TaxID=3411322 RepID=UPI003D141EFC
MHLRKWQIECIEQCISNFSKGEKHFLCLATPGAGKTTMASTLARKLLEENYIDMVMCFSPSVVVAADFKAELEAKTGKTLNGLLGSIGFSVTYQSMLSLEPHFWSLLKRYRTLVIFDEIHHCAGTGVPGEPTLANAWGSKVISNIQGEAAYTIALTGTPWRSDQLPIVLANYNRKSGLVKCDYSYGLTQAIKDNVCRLPQFTIIDNDNVGYIHDKTSTYYQSFSELLNESNCSYQKLLESKDLIQYCLSKATKKLDSLRRKNEFAGGLIVSTSVSHANQIHRILLDKFGENADIVTHKDIDAPKKIREFKHSDRKWIISVGMISEGTNIPRLQVCCHLTRVKTELYFRQILGRILRSHGKHSEIGYMFVPAEPTLIEYANSVKNDTPSYPAIEDQVAKEENTSYSLEDITVDDKNSEKIRKQEEIILGKFSHHRPEPFDDENFTPLKTKLSIEYLDNIQVNGNFIHKDIRIDL